METLEQTNKHAADFYWLAFLLTGKRGSSIEVTLEALDSPASANSSFSTWMLAWSRKVFIAKALTAVRDELAVSARRTSSKRAGKAALPPRSGAPGRDTTKVELERALLAIDVFPRCALLLTMFEGLSLEDTAILLDAGRDLVRKAQAAGLRELTRNLARIQRWTSITSKSYVVTSEMQHA